MRLSNSNPKSGKSGKHWGLSTLFATGTPSSILKCLLPCNHWKSASNRKFFRRVWAYLKRKPESLALFTEIEWTWFLRILIGSELKSPIVNLPNHQDNRTEVSFEQEVGRGGHEEEKSVSENCWCAQHFIYAVLIYPWNHSLSELHHHSHFVSKDKGPCKVKVLVKWFTYDHTQLAEKTVKSWFCCFLWKKEKRKK